MKAVEIQSGDQFWQDNKLVYTVTNVERNGYIVFATYKCVDGTEGTSVWFVDDDTPLVGTREINA